MKPEKLYYEKMDNRFYAWIFDPIRGKRVYLLESDIEGDILIAAKKYNYILEKLQNKEAEPFIIP